MDFCVCIPCFFPNSRPAEAIRAVAACGYRFAEFWRVDNGDESEIRRAADGEGVKILSLCPDDFVMNDPSHTRKWLDALKKSADKAQRIGAGKLVTQVGQDTGAPRSEQHAAILRALEGAKPILREADITLMIEPLNTRYNHPGYYLDTADEGALLVREADDERIRLILDFYHQQASGGDLINTFIKNKDIISHVHVAGNPGRHEPWLGETDYENVFRRMEEARYTGAVGLEYMPLAEPSESLGAFLARYGNKPQ